MSPEECPAQWDRELLEREFERLRTDSGKAWVHHENILIILFRGRCDREAGAARLLSEMERLGDAPLFEHTLILENMAGRMKKILEEQYFSVKNGDSRHEAAAERCRNAVKRFAR